MSGLVVYGEPLLRLSPPGDERFFQSINFQAYFGGAEVNMATALGRWQDECRLLTFIPDNPIGNEFLRQMHYCDVNTDFVARRDGRFGLYFVENGANQRASEVLYDRSGTAFACGELRELDWENAFKDASWFHFSGITPAISAMAAENCLQLAKHARRRGLNVSCDLNFRSKLWQYGKDPREVMPEIVQHVDVLIANASDCTHCLGIEANDANGPETDKPYMLRLNEAVTNAFPNVRLHAATARKSISATRNLWSAELVSEGRLYQSARYDIERIVDRIGSGDCFVAGLISNLAYGKDPSAALEFATAAGCLKHSVLGDIARIEYSEVIELVEGDRSGRIKR